MVVNCVRGPLRWLPGVWIAWIAWIACTFCSQTQLTVAMDSSPKALSMGVGLARGSARNLLSCAFQAPRCNLSIKLLKAAR